MTPPPKPATLDEAWDIILAQAKRIAELEREIQNLKQNQTPPKPPHFVKANIPSKKKEGKRGPPFGHPFFGRRHPDKVDEEKEWRLEDCPDCGGPVSDTMGTSSRIEIDLPPVTPIVRKHQIHRHWCSKCRKMVSPTVPGLLPHTPYGMNLHLQVSHLKFGLGMTLDKIRALFSELYGLFLSSGVVSEMLSRMGGKMRPVHAWLKQEVKGQAVLHADETGWRVSGINHWLWSFSSSKVVYYHVDRSRGQKVVTFVLGRTFAGVLVSDFYGAYHLIVAVKQKCWVHVLREVKKIETEHPKDDGAILFAKRIKRQIKRAFTLKSKEEELDAGIFQRRAKARETAVMNVLEPTSKSPLVRRLSKRLLKYRRELFIFLQQKEVPAHNNDAERQIRPAVLMRKTSYQNASQNGASTQAILMSVIQTCRKRKIDFFEWGRKYLEIRSPPNEPFSILPATT